MFYFLNDDEALGHKKLYVGHFFWQSVAK